MNTSIFWFRNDYRLTDNPALAAACSRSDRLVLLALVSPDETDVTKWGFPRVGGHRRAFRNQALQGLKAAIERCGGRLLILVGRPAQLIPALARESGADCVFCEAIAAPEELSEIAALREAGLHVSDHWQSSLLEPTDLPFAIDQLPNVFTAFRHLIEDSGLRVSAPIPLPQLPPTPSGIRPDTWSAGLVSTPSENSSFPFGEPAFQGSERAALAHLERYFNSTLPQSYKSTRNQLMGIDYSTKLSPWLAVGSLSARTIYQHLTAHEAQYGANESTYWIGFELLWRDFFRFSSLKHGSRLFRSRGLGRLPPPGHDPQAFRRWCDGQTGQSLVDAGMRELTATGYLSNRMRQIVASYLVYPLQCDWRAGAAWFECRLIDFDIYSNQGNWLYIAGRGADPRGGRQFNPHKQAATHDPDGAYQRRWLASA